MEKKNTILLTVIAIATLLVAVVGATFAYFTATVQTTDDEPTRTTTITTAVLPIAKMTMGAQIDSVEDNAIYPGAKFVRDITITGECNEDTCSTTQTTLEIDATIASEFGSNVTWYLYEAKEGKNIEACTNTPVVAENKYSTNAECVGLGEYNHDEAIKTGSSTDTVYYDIDVKKGDVKKYYLVLEYEDTGVEQDNQQGKNFKVVMDFYAIGTKQPTSVTPIRY